ncbi:hypothetical protein SCOR_34150 [Sulfidibacter corallicola]
MSRFDKFIRPAYRLPKLKKSRTRDPRLVFISVSIGVIRGQTFIAKSKFRSSGSWDAEMMIASRFVQIVFEKPQGGL